MKAAAKKVYGSDSLEGKRVAVQGVGQVGMHLVEFLKKENAIIFITDLFEEKVRDLSKRFQVNAMGQDEIFDLDMDIFSPCALGAVLNDDTISRLKSGEQSIEG
jgi:leucine dehydrogenase